MPRHARFLLILALLAGALAQAVPAGAADWQGRKLAHLPTDFIFGYGSLINTASRNSTSKEPLPAIPVRVAASFGYRRGWNDRSPSGFTALGLRKAAASETASSINGVLFAVEGDDMTSFDAREAGYVRVEVPRSGIEAVGWQGLPAAGHVWVYVPGPPPAPADGEPDHGALPPDAAYPLLESYVDVVVEGGLEYGADFARELVETTDGWSRFWLNDRELARRPWVHDPKAAAVDAILAAAPGPAAMLPSRAFPEVYAEHWHPGIVNGLSIDPAARHH